MEPKKGTESSDFPISLPPSDYSASNNPVIIPDEKTLIEYLKKSHFEDIEGHVEYLTDEYKLPMILMHGLNQFGGVWFFGVTFDEALALIGAARPDKTGVKGMQKADLIKFFKEFDFRDKEGNELLCNDSFRKLVDQWLGKYV